MKSSTIESIVTKAIPRTLVKPRPSLPGPWLFRGTNPVVAKVENSLLKFFSSPLTFRKR